MSKQNLRKDINFLPSKEIWKLDPHPSLQNLLKDGILIDTQNLQVKRMQPIKRH